MMPPSPSKRAIRERVGNRSFSRGERYYEGGALFTLRLSGHRLTAQCRGSAPQPYRLWVEHEEQQSEYDTGWSRQALGGFQLKLLGETVDDEQFIELCRRSGLLQPLVDRLLALNRRKEAMDVAQAASDYELLNLAVVFVSHDLGNVAEELLWERTARSSDSRLEEWLKQYAASNNDWSQALRYATRQFTDRPSLALYNEIQKYAQEQGEWIARREKLLADLSNAGQHTLLISIHLQEDNVEEALALLEKADASQTFNFYLGRDVAMEVAEAAEATHPREAIRLYRQKINRLINARGRNNYATAAQLLKRDGGLHRNRVRRTATSASGPHHQGQRRVPPLQRRSV